MTVGLRAIDIADFFIEILKNEKSKTTNMKLNKLVYFAQGYFLAKYDRPLFNEPIEAWEHGPVVQSIYSTFKNYSSEDINSFCRELPDFSEEERDLLLNVALTYGSMTASQLRAITHKENGAWIKYYKPEKQHTEIPLSAIKKEFINQKPLKQPNFNFNENDFAGKYDSNNFTVLPEDWK